MMEDRFENGFRNSSTPHWCWHNAAVQDYSPGIAVMGDSCIRGGVYFLGWNRGSTASSVNRMSKPCRLFLLFVFCLYHQAFAQQAATQLGTSPHTEPTDRKSTRLNSSH